jgi:hypothetical protein
MDGMYGHENFVPNTHFVRAKHLEKNHGQFLDGFPDVDSAVAKARELTQNPSYQDVIMITVENREALVRVFKGVQWFAEDDLNRQFGDAWRVVAEVPPSQEIDQPLPTA